MIEAVTQDRWLQAQEAEHLTATYDLINCAQSYQYIFNYLGIDTNQQGKTIVEVGCGPYPAVMYCHGLKGIVFEPLFGIPDECKIDISWNQYAFEDFTYPLTVDECWLFNVLQHVRDPEAVVAKSKEIASTVRYFEPVDYGTCVYHPHSFSQADFERWFPGSVNRYTDRLPVFFDADCCYGSWTK